MKIVGSVDWDVERSVGSGVDRYVGGEVGIGNVSVGWDVGIGVGDEVGRGVSDIFGSGAAINKDVGDGVGSGDGEYVKLEAGKKVYLMGV